MLLGFELLLKLTHFNGWSQLSTYPLSFFCGTSNLLFYPCPRLSFLKYEKKKINSKKNIND